MWYVIQTLTGREDELVHMIRRILPEETYSECFVPYYERIWRKQQQSMVHVERLFPGYIFMVTEDPAEVYRCLKNVPTMSRIMSDGMFTFLPLEKTEELFYRDLLGSDHIVRLSYVQKDHKGRVYKVTGPVNRYLSQVVKYQYKKRYALIRMQLLGETKCAALGIILQEDVRQELEYGKIEAPVTLPRLYRLIPNDEEKMFVAGDHVTVVSGALTGMPGVVWKVKKATADIGVRLFGQDIWMEVPVDSLCRTPPDMEEERRTG